MKNNNMVQRDILPASIWLLYPVVIALLSLYLFSHHSVSLLAGILHPWQGLDHLLAMVAVGIWACQQGGKARWILPISFSASAFLACALGAGWNNPRLPLLEYAVAASAVVLAVLCLKQSRTTIARAATLVALFGALHGYVHGLEIPLESHANPLPFMAGLGLSTLALHLIGVLLGSAIQSRWMTWRMLAQSISGSMLLHPAMAQTQDIQLAHAAHTETLPEVQVKGHYDNAVGTSDAASQGVVQSSLLQSRPALRPGEVLEFVPGMIVTQHSGDGKANQYFLRGFNLDHGTDFATSVNGIPVNLPTHAHGHGYTDLNFLMPELVDRIEYRKGPYFAENGDFSSAGSARIAYRNRLDQNMAQITLGAHGYRRSLVAGSAHLENGDYLLGALEGASNNGPWDNAENLRKLNGLVTYSRGSKANGFDVSAMAYQSHWDSTDQVPLRAVESGQIGRFGAIDKSDGGNTARYSLSGNWRQALEDGRVEISAYAMSYRLNLYSNFTYFLDHPDTGDQFEQSDRHKVFGINAKRVWIGTLAGLPSSTEVGLQTRHDRIQVGLFDTTERVRTATTRDDAVRQTSLSAYVENSLNFSDTFRTVAGVRADHYHFNVNGLLADNNGSSQATQYSPKLSLIFGPFARTEYFINYGRGFHSNDARGTLTRVDPKTGDAATPVPGLVASKGFELGVRTEAIPHLQSSLALWQLDIGSELVFVGDAGSTEASRPSRRQGIEWNNRYTPMPWLLFDADLAWSRARFRDNDPTGPYIPGAVSRVASIAATIRDIGPWSGSLQWRYLGRRPLIEDGRAQGQASLSTNLRIAYQWQPNLALTLDVFNLFNRKINDIEYFYDSQLKGETAPVADYHVHPAEPRTARLTMRYQF